ncbi:MAG: hypothetical protein KDN05_16305, partial [Verrucomicrobiae bacterium]|nr:hypothetical protein [Verrucomicrobiae bacterium]
GGLVDHLDFAFTPAREDGLHLPASPGGGGPSVRRQLGILRWFVDELPFTECEPLDAMVTAGVPSGGGVSVFGIAGEIYGLYVWGGGSDPLTITLPAGSYGGRWIDTRSGAVVETLPAIHLEEEGETPVTVPEYTDDIALLLFENTTPHPSVFQEEPSYQTISPQGAPLTLRASVDSAGGLIRKVEFFRNGELIGSTMSGPYELTIVPAERGPRMYEVRVESHEGAVAMSPPAKVFVAGPYEDGVNLNGPETLTPGQTWKADSDAVAAGMLVTQGTPLAEGEALALYPKPDVSMQSLITSQYLWTQSSSVPQLSVSYPLPDGHYEVFVHIVEAVASHSRDVTVYLEGENVAEGIGDLALGEWVNYGPYRTEVTDGVLDLAFERTSKGVPKVASFSVYQATEPVDPAEAELNVRADGNTAVLEFPKSVELPDIESSATLDGGWEPVDLPHADHGETYQIVVPADEPRRFFRLRKVTVTEGP